MHVGLQELPRLGGKLTYPWRARVRTHAVPHRIAITANAMNPTVDACPYGRKPARRQGVVVSVRPAAGSNPPADLPSLRFLCRILTSCRTSTAAWRDCSDQAPVAPDCPRGHSR